MLEEWVQNSRAFSIPLLFIIFISSSRGNPKWKMKESGERESTSPRSFKSDELFRSNWFCKLAATSIWLGSVHFTLGLLVLSILVLPLSGFLWILTSLLVLSIIPINPNSRLGRRLCGYICRHAASYLPITLHVEDFDAFHSDQAYVFGYEPHSVWPIGVVALSDLVGLLPLTKIKVLASSAVFVMPFLRHIWTWCGLTSASKRNFCDLLDSGYSCIVVPGGVQEVFFMEHDLEVCFLSKRKGFVKIAMEKGVPLVPVFSFGQSNVYKWWKPCGKYFMKLCRAIKFTPIIFWGLLGSPVPFQNPIHVVVGKPINVVKSHNPTIDEVDKVHKEFVDALKILVEKYKVLLGFEDLEFKII